MASSGVAALNALLQEMQGLMGILPVAMVPLAPRVVAPPTGAAAMRARLEEEARIEAGFDNLPV
ncbi:MAG: hypothetical protein JNN06_01770 [Gemmobacter sp.]|uniref:hypothetical protein n=1 Tax=Gemmobacter sp. TaxID=1898957 RepID=UPI001A5A83A9|nr:hypothetical protein [Gemmobacter sp.]MBL8560984.1 hypothetical protein [Gemmobacter sp.]